MEASAGGLDVFFGTELSLLPQDDYGLVDIYDARVGGGFPPPDFLEALCEGDACQSPPARPEFPTPASASYQGPGNLPAAKKMRRCAKGKRKAKRLSRRAKAMRRMARRAKDRRRQKGLRQRAARNAKRAKRLSRKAKRCRRKNRRVGR